MEAPRPECESFSFVFASMLAWFLLGKNRANGLSIGIFRTCLDSQFLGFVNTYYPRYTGGWILLLYIHGLEITPAATR